MVRRSVSIVMTYHERLGQLRNTLRSFQLHGYRDVELIVVDDASVTEPIDARQFTALPFPVRVVNMGPDKRYLNSCVPFNIGIRAASGEIVVLQNAECLHVSDVVGHARTHLDAESYLSYACYSLGEAKTRQLMDHPEGWALGDLEALVATERTATFDGDDAWYNHSVHRPVGYHFCSAILRGNMERLGGFDERYAAGIAYEDDELLARIRRIGLQVRIVDDRVVLHQWHYGASRGSDYERHVARNAILFRLVTSRETGARPSRIGARYLGVRLLMPLLVSAYLSRKGIRTRRAARLFL